MNRIAAYKLCSMLLLAMVFSIFSSPSSDFEAQAQTGKIKGTFGAWNLHCGRPPGAKDEKCALVQSVTAEDRPNVGLTVVFLKNYENTKHFFRIVAPLGVLLPPGLGLKIDNADVGHVPFAKCNPSGCLAQVDIPDNLLEKLKTGSTAVFIIFQTPEAGIGIPIQLKGFQEGLVGLK